MAVLREIPVQWHLPNGLEGVLVTHFYGATATATAQATGLSVLVSVLDSNLVTGLSWTIPSAGREIESTTGELTGAWTSSSVFTGAGGATGEQVPDVAQVLLRWRTPLVRRGRFLQGRSYIPALNEGYVAAGNVSSAIRTTWEAAMSTFLNNSTGFGIWGRPLPARGELPAADGVFAHATSGSVWGELAVQRGRRG